MPESSDRTYRGPAAIAAHNELEAALVGFTRMLLHGISQTEVLHQLCQHAMRALHIRDVGISLAGSDGVLYVGETASDLARLIDDRQSLLQEGPCREAFDEARLVIATGDELVAGWPRFGRFARDHGIHGVAAFPLRVGEQRIGVLDCYWTDPGQRLADDALTIARTIADTATVYVLHARRTAETTNTYVEELEAANLALQQSRDMAVQANQTKNAFLSRTSHELRTPLNAILGFAQILELTRQDDAEVLEAAGFILQAGRHLVNLVDDVLDVARIEADDLALQIEPLVIMNLIADTVRLVGPLAAVRDITIVVRDAEDLPAVKADHRRTLQVMLNLLTNATKYNHDGGSISISCIRRGVWVRTSVTDTGPGLTEKQIAKLFVPFERLGAERTNVHGTGIGLVLTKALVERMNGTLDIVSTPGIGSTFSFELPAVEPSIA